MTFATRQTQAATQGSSIVAFFVPRDSFSAFHRDVQADLIPELETAGDRFRRAKDPQGSAGKSIFLHAEMEGCPDVRTVRIDGEEILGAQAFWPIAIQTSRGDWVVKLCKRSAKRSHTIPLGTFARR